MAKPLTDNLQQVLAVLPAAPTCMTQAEIYDRCPAMSGNSVASYLRALAQRGLIEQVKDSGWRRLP